MDSLETNETTALEQSAEKEAPTNLASETPVNDTPSEPVPATEQPAEAPSEPAPATDDVAEEATPVAEEEAPAATEEAPATVGEETPEEETPATEEEASATEADEAHLPLNKEEVVARIKEIASGEDAGDKSEVDQLKVLFYKYHNAEVQEAFRRYLDEGGEADKYIPQIDPLEAEFRAAMQIVRERRAAQQEALEEQKQKNLERKLAILERIQQMASTPEEANQTFNEFKALQAEWKEIKAVPAERATELWKNYQLYVEKFYDLLKLGHELRDYDFRKNLEIKTRLCEQAEALAEVPDVIQAFNQLQGLHQEWKETGPVAKELRDEIWNRFKAASTMVNKRHQAHFEALKAQEEENLAAKTALCEELEGMATEGLKSFADWDSITQKIIALQAKWKTIGYAPQKMNTQIFERFRTACDAFFEKKSQFFQRQKEELNANLARKKELVEKAEALKDSTEWRKTGDALIQLQKQWKEIGAVPRKYSETLWKRFIAACDQFFEAKQAATAGQREEEQGNLQQKQGIIEQLKALASEGAEDVLQKVRELQQQWNEVGHVPFRDKDRLYKEYREICDKLYGALNATQARRRLNNFRNSLAQKIEKEAGSLEGERNRMMRAYERMRDEIKTYENNLGFLTTSSKKGNAMVDAMKKKVEKLREELHLLGEKIKAVDEEMQSEK
ncbi:MAG: DUF349 domain-containing protein [Bacteroidaceae bacterium]|nr:DUF349 domain-containing protein [Bacteroidaceae bacterium]